MASLLYLLAGLLLVAAVAYALARRAGYRITGVSRKFFLLIGALIGALFLAATFWPSSPPPENPLVEPAFPLQEVSSLREGWLGAYESTYGLRRPLAASQFNGAGYLSQRGMPLELQVWLPDVPEGSGYTVVAFNHSFRPGVFFTPDQPTSLQTLAGAGVNPQSLEFLILGFRLDDVPVPNRPYLVRGLLYWRSDLLVYNQTGQRGRFAAPVLLVDRYEQLDPAQLRAPLTHLRELDLRYRRAAQELTIERAEWAAGKEVRLKIRLRNLSLRSEPIWPGLNASTASLPEQQTVTGFPDGPLAAAGALEAQQSLSGYLVFGEAVADPNVPLTVRMPGLSGRPDDLLILTLIPAQNLLLSKQQ
jgi:hypothetical protein